MTIRQCVLVSSLVAGALAAFPAGAAKITEFGGLTAGSDPNWITAGPDGRLWFCERLGNNIGAVTTAGVVSEYPIPTASAECSSIASARGLLFYTEYEPGKLGIMDPTGATFDSTGFPAPMGITEGRDGRVWITQSLNASVFAFNEWFGSNPPNATYAAVSPTASPLGAALGLDGRVWITEFVVDKIGACDPAGTTCVEYGLPADTAPIFIASGPDGNLWFTATSVAGVTSAVGRITPAGGVTMFPIPTSSAQPRGITSGTDGNLWFTESSGNKIGRITTAGTITEYPIPTAGVTPDGIASGPDGNIWFTEATGNKIGRLQIFVPGDANGDGKTDVADVFYLINFLFAGGGAPKVSGSMTTDRHRVALRPVLLASSLAAAILAATPARAVKITEFVVPTANSELAGITSGPDGRLWFCEVSGNNVGAITTAGILTEYPITTPNAGCDSIASARGFLFFSEFYAGKLGIMGTTGGTFDTGAFSEPEGIAEGHDGRVWIAQRSASSVSAVNQFFGASPPSLTYPTVTALASPIGVAVGSDGRIWITETGVNKIGACDPGGTTCVEYALPPDTGPNDISAGPDGNLWFTATALDYKSHIGRITPAGVVTLFTTPSQFSDPAGITTGPDGNLWFVENGAGNIGRVTTAGSMTEYPLPTAGSGPTAITTGPDGNLWFTENKNNKIGRLQIFVPGDANGDGKVDVADVFYLINFLFANGPAPK